MNNPAWYGVNYPTEIDLVTCAESVGARVGTHPLRKPAFINAMLGAPPMILLPDHFGPLEMAWALAHELGHLSLHEGPGGVAVRSKDEAQANRWAACALIPAARVAFYNNASIDAFIAALSAHYEDLPPHNCRERELAHRIALYRLDALRAVGR